MNNTALADYLKTGFEQVQGWCYPEVAEMVDLIDHTQRQRNCRGGIAEVGVHHGKLFLLLNATSRADEESYAVDVFERQDLNIDSSGQGDRAMFEQNLRQYDRHRGANVRIIAGDSTDVTLPARLVQPVRFFSVDGGHTVEHTLNDLKIAQRALISEGVVILDDILNNHWLGVIEGAIRYLMTRPTLVPFAIGYNKLLMCNLSHAARYHQLMAASPLCKKAEVDFCGYRVVAM